MRDENIAFLARNIARSKEVNALFKIIVAGALQKLGEQMAAEKIKEGENEQSQNMGSGLQA